MFGEFCILLNPNNKLINTQILTFLW
jgi:hypothetical protein